MKLAVIGTCERRKVSIVKRETAGWNLDRYVLLPFCIDRLENRKRNVTVNKWPHAERTKKEEEAGDDEGD